VSSGDDWNVGDVLEWTHSGTIGGELALVRSKSGNDLTVVRGYEGTTAETHASGDRVVQNPNFYHRDIVESIDEVLNTLWPNVWTTVSQDVTPDTTAKWIDSALSAAEVAAVVDLSSVGQVFDTDNWGAYGPRHGRRVWARRNLPTATWTSGIAVRFPDGYWDSSAAVTFRWRAKITDTVAGGDYSDLDDGGLLAEGVVWLAASRLITKREAEGLNETLHEGSATYGAHINSGSYFELVGKEKIAEYREELKVSAPRMANWKIGA
jgi:hypothetical protein